MTITSNQATRLKFITETLAEMLEASHFNAGQHDGPRCEVCNSIRRSRETVADLLDRRSGSRFKFHTRVLGDTGRGRFETDLLDLSTSGAFLESIFPFPQGTPLTLKFKIDSGEITVPAEVAYSIQHVGFGVRFVDLLEKDRQRISSFITAREHGRK
ncbi:MAG TPA: PilZ domain-containing protein [Blastocatellia bacterium]|nr:PilZ domain-containing protein [Blastocatellia bacterium]